MCPRGVEFVCVLCKRPHKSGLPVFTSSKQHACPLVLSRSHTGTPNDLPKIVPVVGIVDDNDRSVIAEPLKVLQIDARVLVNEVHNRTTGCCVDAASYFHEES